MPLGKIIPRSGLDLEFIALSGAPCAPGSVWQDISRPGKHGLAARDLGRRGEPFEMIGTRDHADGTAAQNFHYDLQAAAGDLVTLVDDFSNSWLDVLIHRVIMVEQRKIAVAVGGLTSGGGTVLTVHRFIMQITSEE